MLHSQLAGQQLSEKDLLNVMEELADVRAKWYNIGLGLGLSVGTLNSIEHSNNSDYLRATLMKWLNAYSPPPTWSKVVEALRTKTVDEARLAAHLEHKCCSMQDSSVAATLYHAPPAPSSQADTQTTSPQQSQLQAHVPPAPSSQTLTWTTPPTQHTIPPMQPPVLAYSGTPSSHPPRWSVPYYYSPHTGYPPFPLTPPPSGAVTASVHPSYSQIPQVTPTSSRPLLSSLSALRTAPQLPTTRPQYPSPPSLTTIPPSTSPIPLLAIMTMPPHLPLPVTTHTLGKKAKTGIFCTMFHLSIIYM